MGHVVALIVAAGRGHRCEGATPKQYRSVAGAMVLRYSVEAFLRVPEVDHVLVVIHPDDHGYYKEAVNGLDVQDVVFGGARRQDSVRLGLEALAERGEAIDTVLIHDAARLLVSTALIQRVLEGLVTSDAVAPVLPVTDTLKVVEGNRVVETVVRDDKVYVQTPQGFAFSVILRLHREFLEDDFTDDVSLCEHAAVPVAVVPGDQSNFKLTNSEDLYMAERCLAQFAAVRVGMGTDVHRFSDEESDAVVMLCGIAVPHTRTIVAHSDGDVGLHALVDALLGTIAAGDIGMHFPPTDPQWQDVDSSVFVQHAYRLVCEKGGCVQHVDITLMAERPKVRPYVDSMRVRISELLDVPVDSISIKATTTEKLGFLGRGEGIAAQSVVTVSF